MQCPRPRIASAPYKSRILSWTRSLGSQRDSVQEGGEIKPARPEHTHSADNRTKRLVRRDHGCKSFVALPVLLHKHLSSYLRVCNPKWW